MDFIKAVSIIGRDLEEAIALLDQLSAEGGKNVAEIEIARLRVRSASELLRLLPGLRGAPATGAVSDTAEQKPAAEMTEPVAKTPEPAAEMTEPAPKTPEFVAGRVETVPGAQELVVEKVVPVRAADPAIIAEQVKETVVDEVGSARAAEHAEKAAPEYLAADIAGKAAAEPKTATTRKTHDPQKAILADRFAASGTLGEKISSKQDGAVSTVMQGKPIADIGAAIGMNDKFYFIRELFSGDAIAYHDTIRRLNASSSLGEAMKILDESTVMGSDPSAQSSFVDVVRRKFNIHV